MTVAELEPLPQPSPPECTPSTMSMGSQDSSAQSPPCHEQCTSRASLSLGSSPQCAPLLLTGPPAKPPPQDRQLGPVFPVWDIWPRGLQLALPPLGFFKSPPQGHLSWAPWAKNTPSPISIPSSIYASLHPLLPPTRLAPVCPVHCRTPRAWNSAWNTGDFQCSC